MGGYRLKSCIANVMQVNAFTIYIHGILRSNTIVVAYINIYNNNSMNKQTILVLDVLAIVALLIFSAWGAFIVLLAGPGYLSLTIGMLANAGGVGAVLYILSSYKKTGRILSILLLAFGWLFGLMSVVFGFAPGEFSEVGILIPKAIIFAYPILFLIGVLKENVGDKLFKGAVVLYAGLSLGEILLVLMNAGVELTGAGFIALMFIAVWLFAIIYPLYRLFMIGGFLKK